MVPDYASVMNLLKLDLRLILRYHGIPLAISVLMFLILVPTLLDDLLKESWMAAMLPVATLLFVLEPLFYTVKRASGELINYSICGIALSDLLVGCNRNSPVLLG